MHLALPPNLVRATRGRTGFRDGAADASWRFHPPERDAGFSYRTGAEKLGPCDDFDDICSDKSSNVELSASAGTFVKVAIRRNRIAAGHGVGFEYQPALDSFQADLRCVLAVNGKPVSEVWLYRAAA